MPLDINDIIDVLDHYSTLDLTIYECPLLALEQDDEEGE